MFPRKVHEAPQLADIDAFIWQEEDSGNRENISQENRDEPIIWKHQLTGRI